MQVTCASLTAWTQQGSSKFLGYNKHRQLVRTLLQFHLVFRAYGVEFIKLIPVNRVHGRGMERLKTKKSNHAVVHSMRPNQVELFHFNIGRLYCMAVAIIMGHFSTAVNLICDSTDSILATHLDIYIYPLS